MAIISRVLQKIFGASGPTTEFGKIGSDNAGSPTTTKDLDEIQSLTDYYDQGLFPITNEKSEPPRIEDFNSLFFMITTQLKYLFQNGIPEWIATENYYALNSFCSYNGVIYQSLLGTSISPNINNNPESSPTYWRDLFSYYQGLAESYADALVAAEAALARNADNLTSGTIPDNRLPDPLPAISGANLNNLNASNLGSGSLPFARTITNGACPPIGGTFITPYTGSIGSPTYTYNPNTIFSGTGWTQLGSFSYTSNGADTLFSMILVRTS